MCKIIPHSKFFTTLDHMNVHCCEKVDDSPMSPMCVVASVCHNKAPFRRACFKCFYIASQVAVTHSEKKPTVTIQNDKYLKAATCFLSSSNMQLSLKNGFHVPINSHFPTSASKDSFSLIVVLMHLVWVFTLCSTLLRGLVSWSLFLLC